MITFFDDIDKFPSYDHEDMAEIYHQIVLRLFSDIPSLFNRPTILCIIWKYVWKYNGVFIDFKFKSLDDNIRY